MTFYIRLCEEATRLWNLGQGRPPFVASRHFPRFIGDIYPAIKYEIGYMVAITPFFGIAALRSQ